MSKKKAKKKRVKSKAKPEAKPTGPNLGLIIARNMLSLYRASTEDLNTTLWRLTQKGELTEEERLFLARLPETRRRQVFAGRINWETLQKHLKERPGLEKLLYSDS